jgi:hypothetical protein
MAVHLNYYDAVAKRSVELRCANVTLAGQSIGVVGSDAKGDVWSARNAAPLGALLSAPKTAWRALEALSTEGGVSGPQDLPALAADNEGKLYALWSQLDDGASPRDTLYAAVWDGTNWSRALAVLHTPDDTANNTANSGDHPGGRPGPVGRADQPSLTSDGHGKLHIAWNGGAGVGVLYSRVYVRDVTSAQGWAEPVRLPAPSAVNSWPEIVADQRGDTLYVIYAVPYNEQRGIYLTRSIDGGTTWLTPTAVFDAQAAGWISADYPRLALDANLNILHALWLQQQQPMQAEPDDEMNTALFYARSLDGGQSWGTPLKVAEGSLGWPQVVVPGPGQVYLAWNQTNKQNPISSAPMMVWGQFSPDAGERWTKAEGTRGFDNISGPAGFVSDGAGSLYLTALGQQGNAESALLFSRWDGQSWRDLETFGLERPTAIGDSAVPAASTAAGRLGVLMRLWNEAQDGTEKFDLVVTDRTITATSLLPLPTFTPVPTPIATLEPTPTSMPTATAQPTVVQTDTPRGEETSQPQGPGAIVISGALAAIIVAGAVAVKAIQGIKH